MTRKLAIFDELTTLGELRSALSAFTDDTPLCNGDGNQVTVTLCENIQTKETYLEVS